MQAHTIVRKVTDCRRALFRMIARSVAKGLRPGDAQRAKCSARGTVRGRCIGGAYSTRFRDNSMHSDVCCGTSMVIFEKKRNVVNAFTGHLSKVLSKMADSGAKTLTDAKQASETVDSMYHIF